MARVLFFLQLIVALVVLPFWPGLDSQYALWGWVYLAFVLALPALAVANVHGWRALAQALSDGWATRPLGAQSRSSTACWSLILTTLPASALLGGIVALVGSLGHGDGTKPWPSRALLLVLFSLVWGFLAFLLGRILQQVVLRLSRQPTAPLLALTAAVAQRFGLTPREVEAAQAVLDGLTYKGAAERLFVSPATVKSHLLSVYQKTGAGNKIELLRMVEAHSTTIHQTVEGAIGASVRS